MSMFYEQTLFCHCFLVFCLAMVCVIDVSWLEIKIHYCYYYYINLLSSFCLYAVVKSVEKLTSIPEISYEKIILYSIVSDVVVS